jgi:hypothetical protein
VAAGRREDAGERAEDEGDLLGNHAAVQLSRLH